MERDARCLQQRSVVASIRLRLLFVVLSAAFAITAIAALPARADPPAIDPEVDALARAMTALKKRKLELALEAIETPPAATDVLPDYRAWIRARILYALGRHEEARAALPELPACVREARCKHPLAIDIAELTARTYERSAPIKAARLFAALAPDGRLYARGVELFRAARRTAEADALEERLLVDAAHSREARALAAELGAAVLAKKLTVERRKTRILGLLGAHHNQEARDEAELLITELPKKHPLLCELHYAKGRASRKMHDYKNAVLALARARKECTRLAAETAQPRAVQTSSTTFAGRGDLKAGAREHAEDHLLRAALLETEVRAIRHDVAGARKIALWIDTEHPAHEVADDALFFAADALEREGDEQEGVALYERIVREHAKERFGTEAAWRLALRAIERGENARARELLQTIELPGIEGARARYWLARLSEGSEDACARYHDAVTQPALTFYAWLALDRLERTLPECARGLKEKMLQLSQVATGTVAPAPLAFADTAPFQRAKKLVEIPGFKVYASLELGRLRGDPNDTRNLIDLALAFDAIGDHRRAQLALRSKSVSATLASFPSAALLEIWRAAYSRPFQEEVERAAKDEKIDPWLLYAVVREESTFDPEVVSWAGAIGLAQLMPATARAVHGRLKLGRFSPEKLVDPALNLRLGANVLREGLRRFQSSVPLALAAYNGGPGVVVKNMPKSGVQDFDLWIEHIPVPETRAYVKRVMQTYGIYHFLYDADHRFIDLPDTVGRR